MTRKLWLLMAFVAVVQTASGQQRTPPWRAYKAIDGLAEPACSSVTVGPHGKVWVRHFNTNSISGLDGYAVQQLDGPDAGRNRVYETPGGQLWTACERGLREFRDGTWNLYPIGGFVPVFHTDTGQSCDPVPLCPVRLGRVIFLLPQGLMEFNASDQGLSSIETLRPAPETRLGKFLGMTAATGGGLWVSGSRGLARVRERDPTRTVTRDTPWEEFFPPESLGIQNLRAPIEDADDGVTMTADTADNLRKVVVRFDGREWKAYQTGRENIQQAWYGPDRTVWAMTADSLFQVDEGRNEIIPNEEIAARRYYDVAIEPGGTFWLATSDGLFHFAPGTWRAPAVVENYGASIEGMAEDADSRLWTIDTHSLSVLRSNQWTHFAVPQDLTGNGEKTCPLFCLSNGLIVFAAAGQLLQFDPQAGRFDFVSQPQRSQIRPIGLLNDGTLCVQTLNLEPGRETRQLELFDGSAFTSFPYSQPGLRLGNDPFLFASSAGNLWLGGNNGIARYSGGKWQMFGPTDAKMPEGITCMAEIYEDRIWCGAQDKIWECDGKTWRPVWAGFDRVNALLSGRDGSIWVAAENGLHRYYHGAWIVNGTQEGLSGGPVRQVHEDRHGRIWAGTTHGVRLYHPEADSDPPQTGLQSFDPKNTIPEGHPVTISFSGKDKWKYTASEQLLYSYRLDERDWSRFQAEKSATFPELSTGKHYFQVRSVDRNWNVDPKPALLEFTITLPWYQESRLLLIASAGLMVAVFFAALAFNRHRRLVRSHAEVEAKVALRTKQLEIAHRELLHSQKMNALGTLAAGIAHDFNNILSIIKGSAQIIEDNLDNPGKIRTRTDRIRTVVEQGAGIVKAMLGFSGSSDRQLTMCDANAAIGETIKLLGDRFLREVEVQFSPVDSLPKAPASKDFIRQVLLNLIFNAAEAMAGKRQIILSAAQAGQLPPGLVLAPPAASTYVLVSVRDFGTGIAPEVLPRIFEPFFTTKSLSARRGTGLGLSMVYELAQQMDAGIAVVSEPGRGSMFTLILAVRDLPVDISKPKE